jgi:NAD(P)-dependent dehydrogenase (short-subunit alcohol dehydrogenase family)
MNNINKNLDGMTVFITGATSGIGKFATIDLALRGAVVIAAYRDFSKAENLMNEFHKQRSADTKGLIDLIYCDLSSIASINNACDSLKANYKSLDIVINNAGVWNWSFIKSQDGFEEIFAVNVLAPILITNNLLEMMSNKDAKLIYTASGLHWGTINFDDIEFKKSYSGFKAYQQSKLCDIVIARYYSSLLADKGTSAYSMHPGMVNTDLGRTANPIARFSFKAFGIPPEKGAETLIYLAIEDNSNLKNGEYYYKKKVAKTQAYSYNKEVGKKLINLAESYIKKIV